MTAASATTRITTGASLKPDSASSRPPSRGGSGTLRSTEKTAAESVGASTAPISSASCQPDVQQQVRGHADDAHRHRGADRRQRRRRGHHRADALPRRGQATLGQDHDQRRVAERPGQRPRRRTPGRARSRRAPARGPGRAAASAARCPRPAGRPRSRPAARPRRRGGRGPARACSWAPVHQMAGARRGDDARDPRSCGSAGTPGSSSPSYSRAVRGRPAGTRASARS